MGIPSGTKIICNCPDCLSRTVPTLTSGINNAAKDWSAGKAIKPCKHIYSAMRYLKISFTKN